MFPLRCERTKDEKLSLWILNSIQLRVTLSLRSNFLYHQTSSLTALLICHLFSLAEIIPMVQTPKESSSKEPSSFFKLCLHCLLQVFLDLSILYCGSRGRAVKIKQYKSPTLNSPDVLISSLLARCPPAPGPSSQSHMLKLTEGKTYLCGLLPLFTVISSIQRTKKAPGD